MFNTYMGMLIWPMIALGWVVNLMQRGTASWSRIMELMHEKPRIAADSSYSSNPSQVRPGNSAIRRRGSELSGRLRAEEHHLDDSRRRHRRDRRAHRQRQEHAGQS